MRGIGKKRDVWALSLRMGLWDIVVTFILI
jgi:hypothetical protein